ncbi:MAG TPA: FAD/NAD(P)-binding protein, partial [Methyloceanibacter sp.]|nr:FAD/NAD(P)-binding protein [Methyloceanibacter sp.]
MNWAFRQLDQGENHGGLHEGLAHTFLPRQLFGEYVRQRFFEAAEARPDVELKIVNAEATACIDDGGRFTLRFDRAKPLTADCVLLA